VIRRTDYHVAGVSLLVETHDAPAAAAIDELFAGWYLTPRRSGAVRPGFDDDREHEHEHEHEQEREPSSAGPDIAGRSAGRPIEIPPDLETFAIAGGGLCHTDGRASYLAIGRSLAAIDAPGRAVVDVWLDGPPPIGSTELTRIVSYALAAALRRRHRFELHGGAVIDPETGGGVLLIGPSGSGKSTLTLQLAAAGWPFLTDDVLLVGQERGRDTLTAWPLRRAFAITAETFAASPYLRARTPLDRLERQIDGKRQFSPEQIFGRAAEERAVPSVVIFPELTGAAGSALTPLSTGETMTRLIRISPWACYDRSTAAAHLAVLASLAARARGYALHAGRDLLDPAAAVSIMASCTHNPPAQSACGCAAADQDGRFARHAPVPQVDCTDPRGRPSSCHTRSA
jgi:hypothetical protein